MRNNDSFDTFNSNTNNDHKNNYNNSADTNSDYLHHPAINNR